MSSVSSDPINNFESNAGTFRSGASQNRRGRAGDPSRTEAEHRVMDVQDLLAWAYKHELPKDRGLGGSGGEPCAVSPMFAMGAFGTRVDYYHREPGFPAAMGGPHPDALLVEAAVERVALAAAEQAVDEDPLLLPDYGEFGIDERQCMRRALGMVAGLLSRCAKLERPPFWTETTSPAPLYSTNGRPTVVRWEPIFTKTIGGEEVEHEALVPVEAKAKNEFPFGAYCPVVYDPSLQSIADERAEYLVWWGAMAAIAADLDGRLATVEVLSPVAPQRPWCPTPEAERPTRLSDEQRAAGFRCEGRETAAAHRMLGQRRPHGAHGFARSPAARRGAPVRRVRGTAERACAAG